MLLESAGHEIFAASDGREGVEAARRHRPDLVLMDLSLPILSGWEAARQIKSDPSTSGIPVVAVTAHAMQGDRQRALAAGCDGFLAKPIDEETFAATVASYLTASVPAAPSSRAEHEPSSEETAAGTARILVVDDQPEVAALLKTDLETEGHRVAVAGSLEEAASLFRKDSRFDLAVVDVMLGSDSGYELTGELIALSSEYLPVLLVTAGTIDRERGYSAGADDFIGKPIEASELRARARSLIRIGRAIREQGRAIKERSAAYEKLAELDRLKSDFLSTVSHELRTPLNTIILLSHLIERQGGTPADRERRQHDIGVIRESAETLLRMINNILDLAKIEAGQRDLYPQKIDMAAFLRETADLVEPQARSKSIPLLLEPRADLLESVVLDREKLSRVLINLLSNAVKNTERGRVVLRAAPWQGSVTFEVEDTGCGIPAHLVAVAFEPFRQIRTGTGQAPRGTGLGLPICKQLVELMGGDLLFDTREGQGTRVSFTLPLLEEPAAHAETLEPPKSSSSTDLSGSPRLILIVEDDESSRYGLKGLLESEGYEVAEAASLAEADEILRVSRIDAVVLDITLPDGDGGEWASRRQKEGLLTFPVIALTGVTADEDRRRIKEAGVSEVLQKPVDIRLLFDALKGCLAREEPAEGAPLRKRSGQDVAAREDHKGGGDSSGRPHRQDRGGEADRDARDRGRRARVVVGQREVRHEEKFLGLPGRRDARKDRPGDQRREHRPHRRRRRAQHHRGQESQSPHDQGREPGKPEHENRLFPESDRTNRRRVEGFAGKAESRQDRSAPAAVSEDRAAKQVSQGAAGENHQRDREHESRELGGKHLDPSGGPRQQELDGPLRELGGDDVGPEDEGEERQEQVTRSVGECARKEGTGDRVRIDVAVGVVLQTRDLEARPALHRLRHPARAHLVLHPGDAFLHAHPPVLLRQESLPASGLRVHDQTDQSHEDEQHDPETPPLQELQNFVLDERRSISVG